ncbi:MAG: hypothetical protein HY778_00135 [Betaproteobacteria bacterium]|nr:hypothetical protein [Betaproteobacteria bacterium]
MFYKLSWNAQLGAAVALFVISLLVEAQVLAAYMESAAMAYALALALEVSKALTIVLARAYHLEGGPAPRSTAVLTVVFRVGLIVLSGLCASMYLAKGLDRPQLEAVRAQDAAAEKARFGDTVARLQASHQQALAQAREAARTRHDRQARLLDERQGAALAELQGQLNAEMGNRDTQGNFEGRRYRALQERLATASVAHRQALADAAGAEAEELSRTLGRLEGEHTQRVAAAERDHEQRLAALRQARYGNDERVEHPMARAFLGMLATVASVRFDSLQLAFFFALFVAALIELGIYVGFDHIALAYRHVFVLGDRVRQRGDEIDAELETFGREQGRARRKATAFADRVEAEGDAHLQAAARGGGP